MITKSKSILTESYLKTNSNVSQIFIQPDLLVTVIFNNSDQLKSSKGTNPNSLCHA